MIFFQGQISIEVNDRLVSHEQVPTEILNERYINIVEKSSGSKPSSLGDSANALLDETTEEKIIDAYQDHTSAVAIKSFVTQNSQFNLLQATTQDIDKIINSLSSNKATGPGSIPVKSIKLSANAIDSHLTNIINKDIDLN